MMPVAKERFERVVAGSEGTMHDKARRPITASPLSRGIPWDKSSRNLQRGPSTTQGLQPGSPPLHRQRVFSSGQSEVLAHASSSRPAQKEGKKQARIPRDVRAAFLR